MEQDEIIYYTQFNYKTWTMYFAATGKGLCYVGSQNEPFDELEKWVKKKFNNGHLIKNDEKLSLIVQQFIQYIDGNNKEFTCQFDLKGTPFQINIWRALLTIPYGETICYSDVAKIIENPKAVRAVGTAIGANPIAVIIPCHRVLGKDGTLTGYSGGLSVKEKLLQLEGISYKK